jgi:hypothetical protein
MLTPNEMHLLVGLLYKVSNPDALEIELGTMKYDKKAKENRDIDIGLKFQKLNGKKCFLKGVEVKKHKRPLTVETVEQLAAKFKDIGGFEEKGIVSASGYTKGAVNKAKSHNIRLYVFTNTDSSVKINGCVLSSPMPFSESHYNYGKRNFQYIAPPEKNEDTGENLNWVTQKTKVRLASGDIISLNQLNQQALQGLTSQFMEKDPERKAPPKFEFDELININPPVKFIGPHNEIVVEQIQISGSCTRISNTQNAKLYVLRKLEETIPDVGCAVTLSLKGNIMGITFSKETNRISFINITLQDRHLKKIRRFHFK